MFFFSRRSKRSKLQEQKYQHHVMESQRCLLDAATATANAAQDVTKALRGRLEDSVRQFEHTATILTDALFLCETGGTIQSCNPAAGRMFGRSDIVGLSILDLFLYDDKPMASAGDFWTMIETQSCWLQSSPGPHLQGTRPNGRTFWIDPKISRLDWSNGSSSILVIASNMTPIVGLAERAKQNRQRYQAVFDASYDGILIEQNDIIVAANPAITRLFGYDASQLLNRPVAVLFDTADHDKVEANDSRAHFPANGLHESGRMLSMIFTATQIMWDANPARLITICNTTDSPRPEPHEVDRRENGIDMIVCFDLSFRITFANPAFARHYAVSRTELLNRDIRDLLSEDEKPAFLTNLHGLTTNTPSKRMQVQGLVGNVMDWIDHAVFDETGLPIEYQRVGRDITAAVMGFSANLP